MKRTKAAALVLTALSLATAQAFAGDDKAASQGSSAAGASAANPKAGGVSEDLLKEFGRLDANGDGFLTKSELSSNTDLTKAFDAADKNHDGKLDPAEYQVLKAETSKDRSLGSK